MKNSIKAFLLIALVSQHCLQITYDEIYSSSCSADVLAEIDAGSAQAVADENSIKLYIAPASIAGVINGGSAGKLVSEGGSYLSMMMALAILCFLSIFFYLGFCCCCDRGCCTSRKTASACTIISVIFTLTSLGLFIAQVVYIGKMSSSSKRTACGIALVPHDLIEGVKTSSINFIGFKNLTTLLTNFKSEISNLQAQSSNFDQIISKDLPDTTQKAYDSLATFYNKYKNSTTTDGQGQKTQPSTITALTGHVNDAINQEFSAYNDAANKVTDAAKIGKQISTGQSNQDIQNNLNTIISELTDITNEVLDIFNILVTGVYYFNQFAPIGYWVTFGVGIFVILYAVLALFCTISTLRSKSDTCRGCTKTILIFSTLLLFIMGVVAVGLIVTSIGLGSVCHALGRLLTTTDVNAEIASYGVTIDPLALKIINQCLPANATGDISGLLNTGGDIFNQTQSFLDGLTTYDAIKANLTQTGNTSITINGTVNVWKNFKVSIYPDQSNAMASLYKLNSLIDCSKTQLQFNAANCTGGAASSTCSAIYDLSSYTPPACSSDPSTVSAIFSILKTFTGDEDKLLGNMITDLSGSDPSTPESLFEVSRSNLQDIISIFDQIKAQLQNTIAIVSTFQTGLAKITDCRVARLELIHIQSTFCSGINNNLYYFTVFLALGVFFLFMYSWTLCVALTCIPEEKEMVYGETYEQTETYKDGQVEYFDQTRLEDNHMLYPNPPQMQNEHMVYINKEENITEETAYLKQGY